jgi:hypothetical protein
MKKSVRYPNIKSVRGAAGKLPKVLSKRKMLDIAHEDALKKKAAGDDLGKVLDQTQKGGEKFTEEEVEADVLAAVMEVRHRKK